MGIYLKKFENHTLYDSYINSSDAILPNVSICTNEEDVHYNPYVPETRVVAKYNVTSTSSPTPLRTSFESNIFKSMEIDGVMLDELVTEYTFDTTGEHTVKYELYDETKLGNNAPVFFNSNLVEIIIPNSVTSIGDNAFNGCSGLTSITIPDSVTNIGASAFSGCSSLTSIDIPDGVRSIGEHVFDGCKGLTNATIPDSVTSIGDHAFSGCSSLTSVSIGSGVTSIAGQAFYNCSSLTSIGPVGSGSDLEIPNNVTSIGSRAFYYCSGLTNVTIPDSVTFISNGAFDVCTGLTSVTIGNSVTSIGDRAFAYCSGLTSIVIPSSITSIGNQAFDSCSRLISIISNAMIAPNISNTTFCYVGTGGTLTVPAGSTGYDVWMGTSIYYLGYYDWTKVEQ